MCEHFPILHRCTILIIVQTPSRRISRENSPIIYGSSGGSESSSGRESGSSSASVNESPYPLNLDLSNTAPSFNTQHYPAYDANARRVGMLPSVPDFDGSHYLPRTHAYPVSDSPSPSMQLIQDDNEVFFDKIRFDPQPIRSGDDASLPVSDNEIRAIMNLPLDQELSLQALPDPNPGERPGQSLPVLAQFAILGSPTRRLTLQEIFQALEDRFEWFRNNEDRSWQVRGLCFVQTRWTHSY